MHPAWRLLIFLAIVAACIYSTNLALAWLLPHADDTTLFLIRDAKDLLIFLFASWIMGRIEHRTIADYGLPWRRMFRLEFWKGCLAGFAAITGLLVLLRACGAFAFGGVALHGAGILLWAVIYALVFVLVAVREEFRNRGYGLVALTAIVGFWPAAIVTSAFFGLSHLSNRGENWLGASNAALFGLLMCLVLRRTGNLWMPIGFHVAFDWGETYFYGVADSGQVSPGHLLSTTASGPAWLAGGTVGPEGSVVCTLLIVILWLLFAWRLRPTPRPTPSDPPPLPAPSA